MGSFHTSIVLRALGRKNIKRGVDYIWNRIYYNKKKTKKYNDAFSKGSINRHYDKHAEYKSSSPPPQAFLTTYNKKLAAEIFEFRDRALLKLLAQMMNVWILLVLSTRCFQQWGGAKMLLRELHTWIKPGDFIYKTDTYNYYNSINHKILFHHLDIIKWPQRLMGTLKAYCRRIILRQGPSIHCKIGNSKRGKFVFCFRGFVFDLS